MFFFSAYVVGQASTKRLHRLDAYQGHAPVESQRVKYIGGRDSEGNVKVNR